MNIAAFLPETLFAFGEKNRQAGSSQILTQVTTVLNHPQEMAGEVIVLSELLSDHLALFYFLGVVKDCCVLKKNNEKMS